MPRFKALVEYDGTAFLGFQRQIAAQRTVQGELESALQAIFQKAIPVIAAGRTDSGVHATGQVIAFDADWRHGAQALQAACNAHLPEDVVILKIEQVSSSFHPRFDAQSRAYAYRILNRPSRSALYRSRAWQVRKQLDWQKMNEAAVFLIGEHDCATFGNPPQGNSTVRHIYQASWARENDWLTFHIEANAFLYRMVRSVVGSLKLVGDGTWTVEEFVAAFRACDRSRSGKLAPPQGLYLVSVTYD